MIIPDGAIDDALRCANQVLFDTNALGATVNVKRSAGPTWVSAVGFLAQHAPVPQGAADILHAQYDCLADFFKERVLDRSLVLTVGQARDIAGRAERFGRLRAACADAELASLYQREIELLGIAQGGRPVDESVMHSILYHGIRSFDEAQRGHGRGRRDVTRYEMNYLATWLSENQEGRRTVAVAVSKPILYLSRCRPEMREDVRSVRGAYIRSTPYAKGTGVAFGPAQWQNSA
jgi:hypothetical protein